jgi:TolB protein
VGKVCRLEIADADGENARVPVRSATPIISPSRSPDGAKLAYVSFESGKPIISVFDLASGRSTVLLNERGNNSAPAWSPDGRRLVTALSSQDRYHVAMVNADGSALRRLSNSSDIDSEPFFERWSAHLFHERPRRQSANLQHGCRWRPCRAREVYR